MMKRKNRKVAPKLPAACDPRETVILKACEIIADPRNNARQTMEKRSEQKHAAGHLSDHELELDIRARGLDSPVRVRLRPDDRWELVFGFRRHRACSAIARDFPMLCTVQPLEQRDAVSMRVSMLAENCQRAKLRTWELADELYRLHRPPYALSREELAQRTGFSHNHVGTLIRLRSNLAAELWAHWQVTGDSLPIALLSQIVSSPPEEQAAELEELMRERSPNLGRRKGPRTVVRPDTIGGWIDSLKSSTTMAARTKDWIDGASHALHAALSRIPW